jgi:hypothetical protein
MDGALVMASAVCYALFQIWTRRLKSVGNLQAMVTVQHYCYLLSALPFFILNWLMTWELSGNPSLDFLLRPAVAPTATDLIYLGICAFAVLFLSTASSNAYRSVEASLIAPFEYTASPVCVLEHRDLGGVASTIRLDRDGFYSWRGALCGLPRKPANWHCGECHADGGCNLCLTRPKIRYFIRTQAPLKTDTAHKNGQPNRRSMNRDSASNRQLSDQPKTVASQRFKPLWRHWNTRMADTCP